MNATKHLIPQHLHLMVEEQLKNSPLPQQKVISQLIQAIDFKQLPSFESREINDVINAERLKEYTSGCLRYIDNFGYVAFINSGWEQVEEDVVHLYATHCFLIFGEYHKAILNRNVSLIQSNIRTLEDELSKCDEELERDEIKDAIHSQKKQIKSVRKEMISFLKALSRFSQHTKMKSLYTQMRTMVHDDINEYDAEPLFIKTKSSIVNLDEGRFEIIQKEFKMLNGTNSSFVDSTENSPKWENFINEISCGDTEFAKYLQMLAGYWLTGRVDDRSFYILDGRGMNGKSTFLDILCNVYGSYAANASKDTFRQKNHGIRTDLARLKGKRLVVCGEFNNGDKLDCPTIKLITGGDTIIARKLYKEEIEFNVSFKLVMATNYLPYVDPTDKAMWDRIKVLPFDADFTNRNNPNLKQELLQERDGILYWAIEGAINWKNNGYKLDHPARVLEKTKQFRRKVDPIHYFIQACCDTADQNRLTSLKDLYAAFVRYQESQNERIMTLKSFSKGLQMLGFSTSIRSERRTTHFIGIGLLAEFV